MEICVEEEIKLQCSREGSGHCFGWGAQWRPLSEQVTCELRPVWWLEPAMGRAFCQWGETAIISNLLSEREENSMPLPISCVDEIICRFNSTLLLVLPHHHLDLGTSGAVLPGLDLCLLPSWPVVPHPSLWTSMDSLPTPEQGWGLSRVVSRSLHFLPSPVLSLRTDFSLQRMYPWWLCL